MYKRQDQPLIITSKIPLNKTTNSPSFEVSGLSGNTQNKRAWSEKDTLNSDGSTTGIARLWARNKVEEMTDDLRLGGDHEMLKDGIIELALEHHLITEFTAMVAVDRNPDASRQASAKAQANAAQQVPFPQGSLGWRWNLLLGMLLISMALILQRKL